MSKDTAASEQKPLNVVGYAPSANDRELLRIKTAEAKKLREEADKLASPEYQSQLVRQIADMRARADGIEEMAVADFLTRQFPEHASEIRQLRFILQRDSAGEIWCFNTK